MKMALQATLPVGKIGVCNYLTSFLQVRKRLCITEQQRQDGGFEKIKIRGHLNNSRSG
jgi:hypothetical protein